MTSATENFKSIEQLQFALRKLAAERRDCQTFEFPKNLAIALSVAVAELLELFQWMSEEESRTLSATDRRKVAHEMADVLIHLVRLSDVLDIDLLSASKTKIALNQQKYPVEKSKGSSKKYTELNDQ
jgi:dCTP diphosphatase